MAHSGKLELTHYDFLPFPEIQRAGYAIDAGGSAGYDGHLIRTGVDEFCKGRSRCLVLLHPQLPRRALLVPTRNVIFKSGLHGIRQRPLGATVQIDLPFEDAETGTDRLDLLVVHRSSLFSDINRPEYG